MKINHYILLVQKQLTGEISPKEKKDLEVWLKADQANQQIADNIKEAWQLSEDFSTEPVIDMEADFAQLQNKMAMLENNDKPTQGAKVVAMPSRRRWWGAAASVLFLILAGWSITMMMEQAPVWEIVKTDAEDKKTIKLADGSTLTLNKNSTAHVPQAFSATERRIKLAGEAFFEIEKMPNKLFIVETALGEVQVLGTSFNVKVEAEQLDVFVKTGKVRLSCKGQQLELTKGEKGSFDAVANSLKETKNADTKAMFWHSQQISFDDVPLQKVVADLANLYEVELQIENAAMENCPFSNNFSQQSIEQVLETIAGVLQMKVEKMGEKRFLLKGGVCP